MNTRSIAEIRLPASANRHNRAAFLKLLWRVDPDAHNGFGFEGLLLKPGTWATLAQLHPNPKYPEIPVLLEYSITEAHGIPGHRRCDSLYILWRWEGSGYAWRELGRAASASWEWALELRPLAIRALAQARGEASAENVIAPDLSIMAEQIGQLLDEKLQALSGPDRSRLLGILHDQFATRLCA